MRKLAELQFVVRPRLKMALAGPGLKIIFQEKGGGDKQTIRFGIMDAYQTICRWQDRRPITRLRSPSRRDESAALAHAWAQPSLVLTLRA